MLKFRNISLLRRFYVWGLSIITRLAYNRNLRALYPNSDVHPSAERIRRINSELETGPHDWQQEFLQSSGYLSSPHRDDAFQLADITPFLNDGIQALTNDTLSRCFTEQPPHPWNFLTRNIPPGPWQMTPYQSLLWVVGIWARYCIFLPFRVIILIVGIPFFAFGWFLADFLPSGPRQRAIRQWLLRYLASVVVSSWSGYVKFHGQRPRKQPNQIYVSNHCSLIDFFILNKDYTFSCIGQRHSGLAGFLQDLLAKAQDYVWFDREEGNDRLAVHSLLRRHIEDGTKEPMLVFPEGTCTHSQYCIMFKKGSFELGATVHPVAMRYRHHFGDPFWNSRRVSFPRHLFDLMTSWAVVCDVYYLEPQTRREGETSIEFGHRVKRLICEKAELISMNWDGFLKRHRVSPKFLEARQRALASIITRRLNGELPRAASTSVLLGVNGGIQQTVETPWGPNGAGGAADGLDSLNFDKRVVVRGWGGGGYVEGGAGAVSPAAIWREVLSLRRGCGGVGAQRQPPRRIENWAVRWAAEAVHDTVRWVVGMGMLVGAAVVTNRFMPEGWKESIREVWSGR